jgi:hypothetical protein
MVRLGDGRILMAYSNSPDVTSARPGSILLHAIASADGGKTWGDERLLVHDAAYNAARPSFLPIRGGRLWLFYYGFVKLSKDSAADSQCDVWATFSSDDGQTWDKPARIFQGYSGGQRGVLETDSGRIVLSIGYAVDPFRSVSASLVSADAGKTWKLSNAIDLGGRGTHSGAMEPAVVQLKDGRLWMLIRTTGQFYQTFSNDGGLTWGEATPTGIRIPEQMGGSPAALLRLASGRLAVAWNPPMEVPADASPWLKLGRGQLAVALSDDDGKTWSRPVICLRAAHASYPHLLEVAPGQLLLTTGLFKARGEKTDTILLRFTEQFVSRQ